VLHLADKGYRQALRESPPLLKGLNICGGRITHGRVAEAFGLEHHPAESLIG
jgi:alanine dehydrogenase